MAFDPNRLEQAKAAKSGPTFDPLKLEAKKGGMQAQDLPQVAMGAAKSSILAPIKAGKALLTDPTKVAAETPILPVGGAIVAGPAGGAVGEGLREMAKITTDPTYRPTPIESAASMGLAAVAPRGAMSVG